MTYQELFEKAKQDKNFNWRVTKFDVVGEGPTARVGSGMRPAKEGEKVITVWLNPPNANSNNDGRGRFVYESDYK